MAHQFPGAQMPRPRDPTMDETRRDIPEPTPHWPGGPTADDDPTPIESALAALKIGAILAAGVTIVFFYYATYANARVARPVASLAVLAAFCLPSVAAFLRTRWTRGRRRSPGT